MKKGLGGGKNVWLLGSSSFFNDVGSEMIAPILPFYITMLGGGGAAVGLASGLRDGLSSLFKIFGGWYSDKFDNRKAFVFIGYFFSVIFKFLMGVSGSWQQLVGFVSLERFGKLRDAPRDVIVAVAEKKKGKNFGILDMMDRGGAILGTLIVLFFFWKLNLGFKAIIFIAAAVSALSLIPIFFVRDPKLKKTKKTFFSSVRELNPRLKYFIFVAGVFTLSNFGLYMFLLLMAEKLTGSMLTALVFYVIFNVSYSFLAVPFGIWSDKIGRKKVLMMGYLLFLTVLAGFIFIQNALELFILFVLYGTVSAMTGPNHRALVSDLSGKKKGTSLGMYYTVVGLASIPAGLIGGLFWDVNPKAMFAYLSAVALLSLVLLMFVKEKN